MLSEFIKERIAEEEQKIKLLTEAHELKLKHYNAEISTHQKIVDCLTKEFEDLTGEKK